MATIEDRVKTIVSEQLGVAVNIIANESKFVADLGGDSLDTVEMVLTLEDEFNIEVAEEDAEQLDCVQSVIDYLNKLK
jgi:acyl carrier protein